MTAPSPDTIEREKDKLFVTDIELIRRLGVPEDVGRATLRALDDNPASGFPKKQKLWGDRRYLPAVIDYLDRANGLQSQTAARLITERPARTGLPRNPPAAPMRRASNE